MSHAFYCNPNGLNYNFEDFDAFVALPKRLRQRRHIVIVKEFHAKRSLGVNAYYHAIVIPFYVREYFGEMTLNDKGRASADIEEKMKSILSDRFLRFEVKDHPGHFYTRPTSSLTGKEFWNLLLDPCYALFADMFGGNIPLPHVMGYDTREKTYNDDKVY